MVRTKTRSKMILITVHLTEQQIKMLDYLVEKRLFPNRSEAIRVAVRELINRYLDRQKSIEGLVLGL